MGRLFTLHYKDRLQRQGLVDAGSLEAAERLGREWCMRERGRMYVRVEEAILISEGEERRKEQAGQQQVMGGRK